MARFNFQAACHAMLLELGAVQLPGGQRLTLQTIAGPMNCKAHDDWLHCQFDDEKAAVKLITNGSLNRFNGKWNWHLSRPTQSDITLLRNILQAILITPKDHHETQTHPA